METMSCSREKTTTELAYLLLPECRIAVEAGDETKKVPLHTWQSVSCAATRKEEPPQEQDDTAATANVCRSCDLVLSYHQSGNGGDEPLLQLDRSTVPAFDGHSLDAVQACPDCRGQRSDASLLVGLLRSCHPVATLVQGQVQFLDRTASHTWTASLVLTVAFPGVSSVEPRSILASPSEAPTKRRLVTKPLAPPLQLLLTLIRSDWEYLASFLENDDGLRLGGDDRLRRHTSSVFPRSLTLDDVFARLPGSALQGGVARGSSTPQPQSPLSQIPLELLTKHVCPLLEARSLESLRLSCRYWHEALRHVVPGLNLKLFAHQIESLAWMRQREARPLAETDLWFARGNDRLQAASGGQSVLLRPRHQAGPIRIHGMTGLEVEPPPATLSRRVARGGLLCDDPGLGKSITVLSLIAVTAQRWPDHREQLEESQADGQVFDVYWQEVLTEDFRRMALLKLLGQMSRICQIPVKDLRKRVDQGAFGSNFALFARAVHETIHDYVEDWNRQESSVHLNESDFATKVGICIDEFQRSQVQSAKKSYSRRAAKPDSQVAALLEEASRANFIQSLVPSHGTLLVVPSVLLEHWRTQITSHMNFAYLTSKIPLIFDSRTKSSDMTVEKALDLCDKQKTHAPMIFIDGSLKKDLPDASFLAKFQIVITTTQRFSYEWKNGSFQDELHDANVSSGAPSYFSMMHGHESAPRSSCELLKIYWLRMIVDEGHSMGHGTQSSSIQFASWIEAERRWAMTGTPTKKNSSELFQLRRLFDYLKHGFFSASLDGDAAWNRDIVKDLKRGSLASFFRLKSLLSLLMTRHTKLDIAELPPPEYKMTRVPMSGTEVTTYNCLVGSIQSNLLLTTHKGSKTSGKQDSLLHRSQAKHARLALANMRRCCVGYNRVVPSLKHKYYLMTIEMARGYLLSETAVSGIKNFIHHAETEQLSECSCCRLDLILLLIMPCCGTLLCVECLSGDSNQCPICDNNYDVDDLQRFQPGFEFDWFDNVRLSSEQAKARRDATASKRIMSDPASISQSIGMANEDRGGGGESHQDALIRPPVEARPTRKFGDGHECEFDLLADHGKCIHCHHEHDYCVLVNPQGRCTHCGRVARDPSQEETKCCYLTDTLLRLYRIQGIHGGDPARAPSVRPLKAIIYSQFRGALNLVGDRLLARLGSACVAEYWGTYRTQELKKFTNDPQCVCMLLSNDGSEGLDLSFVTHIFFLEEIWDKALQEQAVARAWRMGAKGAVHVETLIASNTVEETMQKLEEGTSDIDVQLNEDEALEASKLSRAEYQRRKTGILLQSLRFMTDYHRKFGPSLELPASSMKMEDTSMLRHEIQAADSIVAKRKTNQAPMKEVAMSASKERPTKRVRFSE